jgi:glycosyltransferase involved in cell wall biosynthesis
MRILMLAQFYPPIIGGEERLVETLSVGLARRGHAVSIATLRHDGLPDHEERDGVRIHRIPSVGQRLGRIFSETGRRHAMPAPDPAGLRRLRRLLLDEQPEIVHGHNWLVHSFVPLKRESGAALVLSLHDMSLVCATKRFVRHGVACDGPALGKCLVNASRHYGPAKGVPVALAVRATQPAVREAVDMFLPVSRAVAQACDLEAMRLPYEITPDFLDDDFYDDAPGNVALAGAPDDGFLLFVGDLVADKGIDVLLDAYAGLDAAPPLVLIGRPYSERLNKELPSNVLMLGPRPHAEVRSAWRRCSVGVAPSIGPEAFGLAALEAQATGTPIVATRAGGLVEVVIHEETGLLVAPGDAKALRAALQRLLSDADTRARMGRAARRHAARFALPRIEDIYARVRRARAPQTRASR